MTRYLPWPAVAALALLTAHAASAQKLSDLKPSKEPLVLQEQGSFFVGGRDVKLDQDGWNQLSPAFGPPDGDATVEQMYVQYQKPPNSEGRTPVVFVHGCCLTSKTWETTPDGRMGWYEYFTRQGRATYLAEQSGRARSGFNGVIYNQVQQKLRPPSDQPPVLMWTHQLSWSVFRFGPKFGEAWPDEQFPLDHAAELYKQEVPDMILTELPDLLWEFNNPGTKNPTIGNMASLAEDLGGVVYVTHSQSSGFAAKAALAGRPGIKGIIQIETGCFGNLQPDQVATLAKVPMLIVVGDHLPAPQPPPTCVTEIAQIKAAGGDITFLALPDAGLHGNSHMMMQDKNNLAVADVLLKWIDQHVDHKH